MALNLILLIGTGLMLKAGWQLATDQRHDPQRHSQWWMFAVLGGCIVGVPLGFAGVGSTLGALFRGYWKRADASTAHLIITAAIILAVAFAVGFGVGRLTRPKPDADRPR